MGREGGVVAFQMGALRVRGSVASSRQPTRLRDLPRSTSRVRVRATPQHIKPTPPIPAQTYTPYPSLSLSTGASPSAPVEVE